MVLDYGQGKKKTERHWLLSTVSELQNQSVSEQALFTNLWIHDSKPFTSGLYCLGLDFVSCNGKSCLFSHRGKLRGSFETKSCLRKGLPSPSARKVILTRGYWSLYIYREKAKSAKYAFRTISLSIPFHLKLTFLWGGGSLSSLLFKLLLGLPKSEQTWVEILSKSLPCLFFFGHHAF